MRPSFRCPALHAAVLLCSTAAASAAAQDATPPAPVCDAAELRALSASPRVSIAGGRVSMVPPHTRMMRSPPGEETETLAFFRLAGTSVIVSLGGVYDPAAAQAMLGEMTASPRGLRWISRGAPAELAGMRWQKAEFVGNAVGTPKRTELYTTSFQGRLLSVSVTVMPASSRERWQDNEESGVSTLRVLDCALPAEAAPSVSNPPSTPLP